MRQLVTLNARTRENSDCFNTIMFCLHQIQEQVSKLSAPMKSLLQPHHVKFHNMFSQLPIVDEDQLNSFTSILADDEDTVTGLVSLYYYINLFFIPNIN